MTVESPGYRAAKAKKEFKYKGERTDLQRSLGDLLHKADAIIYLLAVTVMVLIGVFIRLVVG